MMICISEVCTRGMAFDVDQRFTPLLPLLSDVPPLNQQRYRCSCPILFYIKTIRNIVLLVAIHHQDLEVTP